MAITDGLVIALLAAGRSTRFGADDKLAAMLGERPLIAWTADAALSVPAMKRLVIVSEGATTIPHGFDPVVNDAADMGLSTSLRLAARAAQDASGQALMILLADMPFVGVDHVRAMIARFDPTGGRALFSRAAGGPPMPPALFPASLFANLLAAEGDQGARALARQALIIETDADRLIDIDTPSDLARARDRLG